MNFLCLLCHESAQKSLALCKDCEKMLPYHQDQDKNNIYTQHFNKTVILFDYLFPVDCLITQLKFQYKLMNANLLGNLLANKIKLSYQDHNILPELLIPVPLHIKRLRERGFNQALEITKILSKKLNIAIDKSSCYRTRYTIAQSELPRKDRLKNLHQAFGIKKTLSARHVVLIDDVITTGQTLRELAEVLRKSGVEKIDIWCCAKTVIHSDE